MQSLREYDLVVFGATGFSGQLVAEYLVEHAPSSLRWALAGRHPGRLHELRAKWSKQGDLNPPRAVLHADLADRRSLEQMARKARLVLSTVGPYAPAGANVVAACIEEGSHYLDLSGEPDFVERSREHFHELARLRGVRIVHACGFDSIPHDLGVLYAIQQLQPTQDCRVEGFVEMKGDVSGGTWASALEALAQPESFARHLRHYREGLQTSEGRRSRLLLRPPHRRSALDSWLLPFPSIDGQVIVRSALERDEYGKNFEYAHYLRFASLPAFGSALAGLSALTLAARWAPSRRMLQEWRPQGSGPTAAQRRNYWFRLSFRASAEGREVWSRVEGGDPGYEESAKMIAEAALCSLESDRLTPRPCGVLTPAVAFGEALIERLQRAGIRFSHLDGPSFAR